VLPVNAEFAPFLRLMLSKSFPAVACFPDNNLRLHFVYYRDFYPRAYARGGGVRVNRPLELDILQKLYYLRKEIKCFRILFAC